VKAAGYGVYGDKCDGNDVFAVLDMTRRAVEHARAGNGAALLEVLTYRRKGHAEHDSQQYVPPGELEEWESRDPVDRYVARVIGEGWVTQEELEAVDEQVTAEVDAAREEAEASPMPEPEEALAEVYGDVATRAPWTRRENPDPHEA
jgi:TPP-dependent pyruvate/acetoin dehydrogenase alpha subunit